jgi:hypothetical protein
MKREITGETVRSDADRPSTAVVLAVAQARGVDAVDLESCLNDVIDPDALDRLFVEDCESAAPAKVEFTMANCTVVVHDDGSATAVVNSTATRTGATT